MHLPEFRYYDPFFIVIFSSFSQQRMNEENGKRHGATTITSDVTWLAMLQHTKNVKCWARRDFIRSPAKKYQEFSAPSVRRSFTDARSECPSQHCQGFVAHAGNWEGLSFWFTFHEKHHVKIYGYCVDIVSLKTPKKTECSLENSLHLVNFHVQESTIGVLLTTKG